MSDCRDGDATFTLATRVGLVAVVLVLYGVTLGSAFVWDDHELLRLNDFYRNPDLTILVSPRYFAASRENGYRPLVTMAHLANHALTGMQPWGFRLGNVLLHVIGVLAVFGFARDRFGANAAVWAAVLYAVHPLHAEAVNVATLRADLLCVPLALLSLVLLGRPGTFFVGIAAYGLALLAKEAALVVPFLWWLDQRRRGEPWRLRDAAILGLTTLAYLWLRFVGMANPELPSAAPLATSALGWLAAWTAMLGRYAVVVLAPLDLCASYGGPPSWWPWSLVGVGALAVAVLTAVRVPHWRHGLAWFLVGLVPVAGFVPLPNPMAERYLTVPFVGLCLAFGVELSRHRSRPVLAAAVGALLLLCIRTVARNGDWRSDEAIWGAAVRDCPASARALVNYAAAVGDRGDEVQAVSLLRRALALEPGSRSARLNIGLSLLQLGQLAEARSELEALRDAAPDSAVARTYLALVLVEQGELPNAERELHQALALDPHEVRARVLLARVYRRAGRSSEAHDLLVSMTASGTASAEVHYELAVLLAERGDNARALEEIEHAVALGLPGAADLRSDAELAPLHGLPAFEALIARASIPQR